MLILAVAITAVIAYLLGSCNSAIIVIRLLKHEDIREHGSKNAGLTNTLRCYGKGPALLTLIGDLSKGVIAVLISKVICNLIMGADYWTDKVFDLQAVAYIAGIFAIIGHIFPIYYGFKGGKGVLVASSVLIVCDPVTFCIIIPVFILIVAITRYVSVASISAAVLYPIITFCVNDLIRHAAMPNCILYTILTAFSGIILIYMHRANIERLKNGTENKFGQKKKENSQ